MNDARYYERYGKDWPGPPFRSANNAHRTAIIHALAHVPFANFFLMRSYYADGPDQ
jgi:hypothetical protein